MTVGSDQALRRCLEWDTLSNRNRKYGFTTSFRNWDFNWEFAVHSTSLAHFSRYNSLLAEPSMRISFTYRSKEEEWGSSHSEVIVGRVEDRSVRSLDLTADSAVSRLHARIWQANGLSAFRSERPGRRKLLKLKKVRGGARRRGPLYAAYARNRRAVRGSVQASGVIRGVIK
jgi:hypothetical protein